MTCPAAGVQRAAALVSARRRRDPDAVALAVEEFESDAQLVVDTLTLADALAKTLASLLGVPPEELLSRICWVSANHIERHHVGERHT